MKKENDKVCIRLFDREIPLFIQKTESIPTESKVLITFSISDFDIGILDYATSNHPRKIFTDEIYEFKILCSREEADRIYKYKFYGDIK